jgi:hypothetical protein
MASGVAVAAVWVVSVGIALSCPALLVVTRLVTTALTSSFDFSVSSGFFRVMQFEADLIFVFSVFSRKGVREVPLRRLMRNVNKASFAEAMLNVVVCLETSRVAHFTREP